MPKRLDKAALREALFLRLRVEGPLAADALLQSLKVSQPALSRLVRDSAEHVLIAGRARATRYAARRSVAGVGTAVPIYEVLENAKTRRFCVLHAVEPKGFFVEPSCADVVPGFHDDLPYFLYDQRPSGFLGRLIPKRHPDLRLPDDVRLWSAEDCLRYLTRFGSNQAGSLLVGEGSFQGYLEDVVSPLGRVADSDKPVHYVAAAQSILSVSPVGSSAAGEQPKFLGTLMPGGRSVLVKFSPRLENAVAQRTADLLVCEHIAHETLSAHGVAASRSQVIEADHRIFLEVDRFDRCIGGGRRGCISLFPLNAEFLGGPDKWEDIAEGLRSEGIVTVEMAGRILWLDIFGQLIANNDRHPGNISLFTRGSAVLDVAPAYDMLPMLYAPRSGELLQVKFAPPLPSPRWYKHWRSACTAAVDFWQRVANHSKVSTEFQHIGRDNVAAVRRVAEMGQRLPP